MRQAAKNAIELRQFCLHRQMTISLRMSLRLISEDFARLQLLIFLRPLLVSQKFSHDVVGIIMSFLIDIENLNYLYTIKEYFKIGDNKIGQHSHRFFQGETKRQDDDLLSESMEDLEDVDLEESSEPASP